MHAVAFHFAEGDAFFSGVLAILTAGFLSYLRPTDRRKRVIRLLGFIGVLFVMLSATPLPWWLYGIWGTVFVGWMIFIAIKPTSVRLRLAFSLNVLTGLLCLTAVTLEIPYRFMDRSGNRKYPKLIVIGDSISAGSLGPNERTWPKLFREKYKINVVDLSQAGATTRSVLNQVENIQQPEGLVLIEIGGNDFFGETTSAEFEHDLEELLRSLRHPQSKLVMIELPLPPFLNEFGRIQRRLAENYGATLIPRRRLMEVLASPGATIDTIHLSEEGHQLMAEMIWRQVGHFLESDHNHEK
jgi:acyl-CoA thioesterase-1